ncbi:MAG: HAD family hydrolase [Coprococcus sp.]
MYKAVLFDMDGVIFDSEIKVLECWKEIAEKYHIEDIESVCRACLGLNRDATKLVFQKRYGQDFPYDVYKSEMSDLFHKRYGEGRLPLKPGVIELLQFLKGNDKKIALASSTRLEIVTQELRDAGLIRYFDAVICGDMVERSKPEPDIFLKACDKLNVRPESAVGIEDSYNGIRALAAAGIRAIMVPDLMEASDEMHRLAEIILPDLNAVKEYLI